MTLLPLLIALVVPSVRAGADALVPTEEDQTAAEYVARMDDDSPQDRLIQMLRARELSMGALFVLAGADPVLVDQVLDEKVRAVLDWVAELPATRMSELRSGQTVVRSAEAWTARERERLEAIAARLDVKTRSLTGVRIGAVGGAHLRFEMVGKKGGAEVVLALPAAPSREEKARDRLTARFGARPAEITSGPGTRLPIEDASFERGDLGGAWQVTPFVEKGNPLPAAEVTIDRGEAMDGVASLRFHADAQTRSWPQVTQTITVVPFTTLVLRGHVRTRFVRRERDQERNLRLAMVWLDIAGTPLGDPVAAEVPTGDMDWRAFVVKGEAPSGTSFVQVSMACTMSGTAWFDGLQLEIGY